MSSKMKFLPIVTKVKLNPEQAVVVCTCWGSGRAINAAGTRTRATVCGASARTNPLYNSTRLSAASS